MFGSAFGVGLGGCLGIIAAFIVVFFLIAFCTAALGGGGGGGGRNKGASRAYDSAELAYAPNREEEDVFHDVRISTRLLEGFPLPPLHIHTPPISTSLSPRRSSRPYTSQLALRDHHLPIPLLSSSTTFTQPPHATA
jgi:hypothetical protein